MCQEPWLSSTPRPGAPFGPCPLRTCVLSTDKGHLVGVGLEADEAALSVQGFVCVGMEGVEPAAGECTQGLLHKSTYLPRGSPKRYATTQQLLVWYLPPCSLLSRRNGASTTPPLSKHSCIPFRLCPVPPGAELVWDRRPRLGFQAVLCHRSPLQQSPQPRGSE